MKIPRITVIYYHFGYFGICLDLEPDRLNYYVTPPFSCILSSKILYIYKTGLLKRGRTNCKQMLGYQLLIVLDLTHLASSRIRKRRIVIEGNESYGLLV